MRAQLVMVLGLVCLSLSGPAWAGAEAKLEAPAARKIVVLDGRVWTCVDRTCVARGEGRSQSLQRECARVARKLGRLTGYRRQGAPVDGATIAVCNAGRAR